MKSLMAEKIEQVHALSKFGPQKCSVYLNPLQLGAVSTRFEQQVNVYSINESLFATNRNILHEL